MERELTSLLEEAAQRDTPFVPDIDQLVRTGRRRTRRRQAVASAGALVSVVAVVVGVTALVGPRSGLPGQADPPQPAATGSGAKTEAPQRSATDSRIAAECSEQHDGSSASGKQGREPEPSAVRSWAVAVSASDASGTSAVLLDPNGVFVAVCSYPPAGWAGGTGEKGIDFFRTTTTPAMPTGWKNGLHLIGWANNCSAKSSASKCDHESWGGAGRLPREVARVTIRTRDGFTGEAKIRNGYMAYQHLAPFKPMTGSPFPPVIITMYDAHGKKLVSYDQNYMPSGKCPASGGC